MPAKTSRLPMLAFTLVELLSAVLLVSAVGAAAIATWGFSSRVIANKRVTEMATYLGTREIERLKAKTYSDLATTTSTTVTYYDKTGASQVSASTMGYMVESTVTVAVSRGGTPGTADLHEIQVQVWSSDGTTRYDDGNIRTLVSLGAL